METSPVYTRPSIKEVMGAALRRLLPPAELIELTPASIQYYSTGETNADSQTSNQ